MYLITLHNLIQIDIASDASSGLVTLGERIWRNLMVLNICSKTRKTPGHGASGAYTRKFSHRCEEEASPKTEATALAAGLASAIKLMNAKAAAHSVVRSDREHKDGDDDDGDGDDADGSGAN
jgi:hypothetical protein